ncbi:MAG: HEAT repeat domain-containing protein [Myxococcota bacterium]
MSTIFSVLVFFLLFGAMFGLPVMSTVLFWRHRENRLQQVLQEIKRLHRLRGRGRAQLVGRIADKPLRITRDARQGVMVSVDLLPTEVRRRHAQWPKEKAQSFTRTLRRMLGHVGVEHAEQGERVEGRWTFALGAYPTVDAIENALSAIREGLTQEVLLAEVAAAAHDADEETARARLNAVSRSEEQPPWLRAEAYRALIGQTENEEMLTEIGDLLSVSTHPTLRSLAAEAWGRVSNQEASGSIRALLRDENPGVVETAARLVATRSERADADAEKLLLERLNQETGPLLFVIVRALGTVGSSRALAELGRWCDQRTVSMTMRETVWRESARIRSALGLNRAVHGGQLSMPPAGGELSPAHEDSDSERSEPS